MFLHNTQTKKKERFVPRDENGRSVSMYVCGVTVYDYSHIGHARVYVAFDVLFRQLMSLGYDVTYVRNFTDVDDKIIARANENGETCDALVDRFVEAFREDVSALNCLPNLGWVDHQPFNRTWSPTREETKQASARTPNVFWAFLFVGRAGLA